MKLWFLFVGLLVLSSCIPFTDEMGRSVGLKSGLSGLSATKNVLVETGSGYTLNAMVKGSIYETGEEVSVFGTCLDAFDQPISGTFATINSWYPNGTEFFSNISMYEIKPGYYLYNGVMSAVQGTYLTELICHVNVSGETAKAWGEWQNPFWVRRISLLNDSMANLSYQMYNFENNTGSNFTEVLTLLRALSFQVFTKLYFYNVTSSFDSSYTVMNTTIPSTSNLMGTTFSSLSVGEHELARRIYVGAGNSTPITNIDAGIYRQHTSVNYTSGTRDVRLHSELYIRNVTGGLTRIGTSLASDPLITGIYQDADFVGTILADHVVQSGEYLVMILNATVISGGSAPTIDLLVGGFTGASLELGANVFPAQGETVNITVYVNMSTVEALLNAINNTLFNVNATVSNISVQLGNMFVNMSNSFLITWDKINQTNVLINSTFTNLSQQITVVGQIANASVDRNDSYLAGLIRSLLPPSSGTALNHTEIVDTVVFWSDWTISVAAFDGSSRIQDPSSYCTMNTTLTPLQLLTPSGSGFTGTVFINELGDFQWTVNCYYT